MRRKFIILLVLLNLISAHASDEKKSLVHDGRTRTYYLHLPPQYDGHRKLPMVLLLHGGGGSAKQALSQYPMQDEADRAGFILVTPDGTGPLDREILRTWNVEFGYGYAQRNHVDDVGFIRSLILKLSSQLAVDKRRVFLTGLSNGAILCHWVAARSSDLIAGIAPVVGTLGGRDENETTLHLPPTPQQPVDVILFVGEQDQHIPIKGGLQIKGEENKKWMVSAEDTAQFWVQANRCNPQPQVQELPAQKATRKTWTGGRNGTRVVVYILHNQGHAWPGGFQPRKHADPPSPLLKAHDILWEFFSQSPPKSPLP